MSEFQIRPAAPANVPILYRLLLELAEYEQLLDSVRLDEPAFKEALFGEKPYLEAIMAFVDDEPVGFALFYPTFPTFLGKPGMYLEDLYVQPIARAKGIGRALLSTVAKIARDRGFGRVDWAVLDWNEPAIQFYQLLGAHPKKGWTVYQLHGDALQKAADDGRDVQA